MAPPRQGGCSRSRTGTTLVELLAAMGLAILVAAVAYNLYRFTQLNLGRPSAAGLSDTRFRLVEALRHDLASALPLAPDTNQPVFLLEGLDPERAVLPSLSFYTAEWAVGADQERETRVDTWHVFYVTVVDAAGATSLVRRAVRLLPAGADSAVQSVEPYPLPEFANWAAYDGRQWTNRWRRTGAEALPQAIKLLPANLGVPGALEPVDFWIPAGLSVQVTPAPR